MPEIEDTTKRGYASGTVSAAPGLALVGENGPELINFRGGGEVVYNYPETSRILAAANGNPIFAPVPAASGGSPPQHSPQEKKSRLTLWEMEKSTNRALTLKVTKITADVFRRKLQIPK